MKSTQARKLKPSDRIYKLLFRDILDSRRFATVTAVGVSGFWLRWDHNPKAPDFRVFGDPDHMRGLQRTHIMERDSR